MFCTGSRFLLPEGAGVEFIKKLLVQTGEAPGHNCFCTF